MEAVIDVIITRCKRVLEEHYGDRFVGLVLYGSIARGENDPACGIDLLDHFSEIRTIIDPSDPVQLESDYLISAKPAAADEYENGSINLYRNAKREGAHVWPVVFAKRERV